MATVFLILAILSEVSATTALKFTDGFTRWLPSAIVIVGYGLSFYLMSLALKSGYSIGILYAIWSAVGTSLIYVIGVAALGETFRPIHLLWLALIVLGVVGLQLTASPE